jgi:hypothetical protein
LALPKSTTLGEKPCLLKILGQRYCNDERFL